MNKKYFLLTCLAAFPFALTAQENNRYEEITNPCLLYTSDAADEL